VPLQFPKKLEPLFTPKRYKVLHGGRASTKSWSVARALVLIATQRKLEVLCAREFQSAIRESVHKLLKNQIQLLGLGSMFRVEQYAIYGPHGSQFVFIGLSDKTAENMKSYEDFDICWVEEAQVVSGRSWTILTPTIRKAGSEIWITFNPELDTDPTWVQFVENASEADTFCVQMNWRDNPWFNEVMEAERRKAKRTMSKADYENIWEGKNRPAVAGAIYADEVAKMFEERRIGDFPVDPFHMVYPVFDMGWNDKMFVIMAQRNVSQLRLVDCIEDDHKTLDWYSRELRNRPYNYGKVFLPHDGGHGNYQTGVTDQAILEGLQWQVEVLPNTDLEDGIRNARMTLAQTFIDQTKCAPLIECLKRYRRSIPVKTGEPGGPLHDQYSHGADCYRYVGLAAPMMDNQLGLKLPPLKYGASGVV
jgi:phage terminase large subunit